MSPHTDPGELLKLADEIRDYIDAVPTSPVLAAMLKLVEPIVRQAASHGREGGEREQIEAEARRYAEMYPQSSDGRNTFVIFADWVAALPKLTAVGENEQHIAWLYQFVRCMNERNWRDMRDNLENQLERMTTGDPAQARGNYEGRHPSDMVLHPLSEIREWDEALAVLGIQDSDQTPADAIRERDAEIERLRACAQAAPDPFMEDYKRDTIADLIKHCASIAEAIDSGRGNEKEIAKAIRALAHPSASQGTEADELISQVEARFPDWKSFRDLVDCIDVTLHRLRGGS